MDCICRHCGLPFVSAGRSHQKTHAFCCFGCSVAFDVSRAARGGTSGSLSPLHVRMATSALLSMAVMMFSLVSYADFVDPQAAADATFTAFSQLFSYLAFLCTIPVLVLLGGPLVRRLRDTRLGHSTWLEVLVLLGVTAAFALSSYNLLRGEGHTYFETVVFTLLLWSAGRYIEARVRTHAMVTVRDAARSLRDKVRRIHLSDDGEQIEHVDAEELSQGDLIRLVAGDRVPVAAYLVRGQAWVDEAVASGEAVPVVRHKGDLLPAGAVVVDATVDVKLAGDPQEAGLAGLRDDVLRAVSTRGRISRLADRASQILVGGTLILGLSTFAFWFGRADLETALLNALSVFLVACPCSLGIAVPLVVFFGIEHARRQGALYTSGDALERAASVDRVFFDRTGTLTAAQPRFAGAWWSDPGGEGRGRIWSTVVAALRESKHPFARALTASVDARDADPVHLEACRTVPGAGVIARAKGQSDDVRIGSEVLMSDMQVTIPDSAVAQAEELRRSGGRASFVSVGGEVVSVLGFEEDAFARSVDVVRRLAPYEPEIITGGSGEGEHFEWPIRTRVSPAEKVRIVEASRAQGHRVAMVGDGLNDAVALAAADLGVAADRAQDINRATADVQLLQPGPAPVAALLDTARLARRRMLQNIGWSVIYNSAGLGLAMAGLLHPLAAAIAMFASSMFVLWNARRWPRC